MEWNFAGPEARVEDSYVGPCPNCPYKHLNQGRKCGSRGRLDSPIVFIAEAPGGEEIRHKLPLIGPSGLVFWGTLPRAELMREWGIPQEDILILNAAQCLPPRYKDDQTKTTRAIKSATAVCRDQLMEVIGRHPRKLIVAMGNHAVWTLTGNPNTKITQIRGQLIPSELAEMGILAAVHPAGIMRGNGNYRQYRMDIEYGIDLVRGLPKKEPKPAYFLVCDTPEKVHRAVKRLIKKPELDCDIETTGLNEFQDDILALGMSYTSGVVYIFPGAIRSLDRAIELLADDSWMDGQESMIPYLSGFFKRYRESGGKLVWHNGKFDVGFMRAPKVGYGGGAGLTPDEVAVDEDTMLMSYTLDEQRGIHDLEQVASDLFGAPDYKNMLKPWVPKQTDSYARVPRNVLYNYLALDVSNTSQIKHILRRRISEDPKLDKLYTNLLIPTSESLYWVEHRGMPASPLAMQRQQRRLQKEIDRAEEIVQVEAHRAGVSADQYINPGSPQQVAWVLFDLLKLPIPEGMQRSTRKEVLEKLPQIPIVAAQREFKKAQKAKGTYADVLLRSIEPATGRIHPNLLIHGTRTGRLAHKRIANIPRDKRLRGMFAFDTPLSATYEGVPPNVYTDHGYTVDAGVGITSANHGRILIKADLDQAELRSLAALSNDPELCAIYRSNTRKLHREVANDIWGSPGTSEGKRSGEYKWGNEEYMRAKALNFGIVYGRQALSIAMEFGITEREAQRYIKYWSDKFPVAWKFIEWCRQAPRRMQVIVTPFGRKKRHWVVTRENLVGLENEASNFPHQSVASDIVLEANNKLSKPLRELGVHTVFLVHDELLVDAPDDIHIISQARKMIEEALEQAPRTWGITRIPFKADTSIGRRWGIYQSNDRKSKFTGLTWAEYLQSRRIHLIPDSDSDSDSDRLQMGAD